MAYDDKAAERVRRALSGRPELVEKRMMGGVCFMLSGNMCAGVSGSAIMIRVGPDAYAQALTQPHVRPLEFGGMRPKGFVLVDPEGYRTAKALAAWIERGVNFASTLPAKKPARKKARRQASQK